MINSYKTSDTEYTATWLDSKYSKATKYCSNCGTAVSVPFKNIYVKLGNFCPNCGFKMTNPGTLTIDYSD